MINRCRINCKTNPTQKGVTDFSFLFLFFFFFYYSSFPASEYWRIALDAERKVYCSSWTWKLMVRPSIHHLIIGICTNPGIMNRIVGSVGYTCLTRISAAKWTEFLTRNSLRRRMLFRLCNCLLYLHRNETWDGTWGMM